MLFVSSSRIPILGVTVSTKESASKGEGIKLPVSRKGCGFMLPLSAFECDAKRVPNSWSFSSAAWANNPSSLRRAENEG
ncbi:hypothetical protein EVAR_41999_1 [Eumeta japonica]|uniref:Uncharacterized protein n=1 Tax=Eumeta variegata TaxID=151549 RepID=A0A4C1WKW3_EUMVA|nr:hypothetical protein EVAR_41999_1 [Eumeta japonica]